MKFMSPLLTFMGMFLNLFSLFLATFDCSWMNLWFLMELNTTSFTILLMKRNNYILEESVVKYFLFQAMASIFLFLNLTHKHLPDSYATLIIFMKLGIFPFHLWFISLLDSVDPFKFILLSTVQKVVPFRMYQILDLSLLDQFLILVGLVGGALYSSSQIKLMGMLGASSIYSTVWIALYLKKIGSGGWLYMLTYFFTLSVFLLMLTILSHNDSKSTHMGIQQFLLVFLILILSAFPPSPLFFFKLLLLCYFYKLKLLLLILVSLMVDPMMIYMYINLAIIMTMSQKYKL